MNGPQGLGFRFGKIRRLSAPENMGMEKCRIRCIPTIYILGVPCFGVPLNIHVLGCAGGLCPCMQFQITAFIAEDLMV